MPNKKRPLIGVITAKAFAMEQRQMLNGILSQAEKLGAETAVFSNMYNFDKYYADVQIENKIYELIASERLDGLILNAESVLNKQLQQFIYRFLNESPAPVIVTGAEIAGYICIDSSVKNDFYDIARHLIDCHSITDIHILTGPYEMQTSHERADGVRAALEESGCELPDENIMFGDFWMPSGAKLAEEYISGKRIMPQAVIFGNDYMAYGLIDKFFDENIPLPEKLSVVGYEHIGNRIYHSPLLTTYQRNRAAVGAKAVNFIMNKITGQEYEDISVSGYMVCGDTCKCGAGRDSIGEELRRIRTLQFYNEMKFCGNFEQQMTVCRSMPDYIRVLQDFSYLLRDVKGIYLCLYENWCSINEKSDLSSPSNNENMICYRIISPDEADSEPKFFKRSMLFPDSLPGCTENRFLYFLPIFSGGCEYGHFIFQYLKPDCYDDMMHDWLKIAVNALQVLRMKNDITALLECTNLSEYHDSVTNLYNKKGMLNELNHALKNSDAFDSLIIILIRTDILLTENHIDSQRLNVRLDVEISECLKKVAVRKNVFCAKLSDKLYAFSAVGNYPEGSSSLISDRLNTLIIHSPVFSEKCTFDSLLSVSVSVAADTADPNELISYLSSELMEKRKCLASARQSSHYLRYSQMRNEMYRNPQNNWDAQQTCRNFQLSYGHFRAAYKDIFSVSFHQDLIQSRLSLAKYLLLTTSLSLSAVAFKCGYDDDKYFMRQFRRLTGITPNKYRDVTFFS